MGKYDYPDLVEDIVNSELERKGLFCSVNRTKINGVNNSQTIKINGNVYLLPDINVYESRKKVSIILRIEVKSFRQFVKKSSPNRKENLIPIKKRQLRSYYKLQMEEEVECNILVVLGDAIRYPERLEFFTISLMELAEKDRYDHPYDKEDALWFFIDDFRRGLPS